MSKESPDECIPRVRSGYERLTGKLVSSHPLGGMLAGSFKPPLATKHSGKHLRHKMTPHRSAHYRMKIYQTSRVLDTLRILKLAENTLVVFTSENGPWLIKEADSGSATPR